MKRRFDFEDIVFILMAIVIVVGIAFSITVVAMHKPDEIIRETADYICEEV